MLEYDNSDIQTIIGNVNDKGKLDISLVRRDSTEIDISFNDLVLFLSKEEKYKDIFKSFNSNVKKLKSIV